MKVIVPLAHCAEGKHTADIRSAWIDNILGMSLSTQGWFMNFWSATAVAGGLSASKLVKYIGRRSFVQSTSVQIYNVHTPLIRGRKGCWYKQTLSYHTHFLFCLYLSVVYT